METADLHIINYTCVFAEYVLCSEKKNNVLNMKRVLFFCLHRVC